MIVFGFWTQTNICVFYSQNICSVVLPCIAVITLHAGALCSIFKSRVAKNLLPPILLWHEGFKCCVYWALSSFITYTPSFHKLPTLLHIVYWWKCQIMITFDFEERCFWSMQTNDCQRRCNKRSSLYTLHILVQGKNV